MRKKKEIYEEPQYVPYRPQEDYRPNMVPLAYRIPTYGITPAPRPAAFVQLPPVSMPVSIVPYVSEDQPLAMYEDYK